MALILPRIRILFINKKMLLLYFLLKNYLIFKVLGEGIKFTEHSSAMV